MAKWTANDIPDLGGKTAVVTGANSGLGYETALELARHGARVVMACRDEGRGTDALERLRTNAPGASAELSLLDLADLASVRKFAEAYAGERDHLDILVNNAGVMALPERPPTVPCPCCTAPPLPTSRAVSSSARAASWSSAVRPHA